MENQKLTLANFMQNSYKKKPTTHGQLQHTMNDWGILEQSVHSFEEFNPKRNLWRREIEHNKIGKTDDEFAALEMFWRYEFARFFEGRERSEIKTYSVVRSISNRIGEDVQTMSKEEFEAKYSHWYGPYEPVKRVDELAKACNVSLKKTVYEGGKFEWDFYKKACIEAIRIIYYPAFEE